MFSWGTAEHGSAVGVIHTHALRRQCGHELSYKPKSRPTGWQLPVVTSAFENPFQRRLRDPFEIPRDIFFYSFRLLATDTLTSVPFAHPEKLVDSLADIVDPESQQQTGHGTRITG